ncbi:MAG: TonB-dependent receptor [Bacteroidota bacterium]
MSHIFFRHIIINLFFLLLMGSVFGQTIKGVVSGKPNQPLDGATVRIESQNRAISTNAQGEFEFLNVSEGTFDINVTYVGFISQTISVTLNKGDTKTVNFSLKTETAQLEEVSIFRIYNKQRFEKKLNAQYFQRTQAIEIKDVFSDLPSVALGGGAPNAQRIYVRGIESSNLNVTIDGAQQG